LGTWFSYLFLYFYFLLLEYTIRYIKVESQVKVIRNAELGRKMLFDITMIPRMFTWRMRVPDADVLPGRNARRVSELVAVDNVTPSQCHRSRISVLPKIFVLAITTRDDGVKRFADSAVQSSRILKKRNHAPSPRPKDTPTAARRPLKSRNVPCVKYSYRCIKARSDVNTRSLHPRKADMINKIVRLCGNRKRLKRVSIRVIFFSTEL